MKFYNNKINEIMVDENKKAVTIGELFDIFDDYGLIVEQVASGEVNVDKFIKVVNTKTTRLGDRYKVEVDYTCTFLQDTGGLYNGPLKVLVTVKAFKTLSTLPTPLSASQTLDVVVNLSEESTDGNTEENTTLNVSHSIKTDEEGYNYLDFRCTPLSVSDGYYAGTVLSWSGTVEIPF